MSEITKQMIDETLSKVAGCNVEVDYGRVFVAYVKGDNKAAFEKIKKYFGNLADWIDVVYDEEDNETFGRFTVKQ